jgi:hypothetical protein
MARKTFFESAIAIPQLEGSTSTSQLRNFLKECCSATAIPQSQFFLKSATSSQQLESFTFAIFGIFLAVEPVDSLKNKRSKISYYCPFKAKFWFPEKQTVKNIFLADFQRWASLIFFFESANR